MNADNYKPVAYLTVHENGQIEWGNKHTGPSTCLIQLFQDMPRTEYERIPDSINLATKKKPIMAAMMGKPPLWWKPIHKFTVDEIVKKEANWHEVRPIT